MKKFMFFVLAFSAMSSTVLGYPLEVVNQSGSSMDVYLCPDQKITVESGGPYANKTVDIACALREIQIVPSGTCSRDPLTITVDASVFSPLYHYRLVITSPTKATLSSSTGVGKAFNKVADAAFMHVVEAFCKVFKLK